MRSLFGSLRVEAIAKDLQYHDIDFAELKVAIASVQNASVTLDQRETVLTRRLEELKPGQSPRSISGRKEIARILQEIRYINKKRSSFEGGFLSTEGIKDREWYKHKGTAPGKVSTIVVDSDTHNGKLSFNICSWCT
jgi:hypothetical protein